MVRFDEQAKREGRKYVEDRRGQGGRRSMGRGGGGISLGKAGGGLGGILIVVLGLLFGVDLSGGGGGGGFAIESTGFDAEAPVDAGSSGVVDPDADTIEYLGALMDDTQDVWSEIFDRAGLNYEFTTIVVFDGRVDTGCGPATSAVGPFYCPAPGDNKVYIDLSFFDELKRRFGAPGDFAQAYVIAHEVGHHIQSVAGISEQVRRLKSEQPSSANELSVRQELQADCFAGVWAHSAAERTNSDGTAIIEMGDLQEGLRAAEAVGDDSIAEMMGGQSNPHNWTHGSAEARQNWFLTGYQTGNPEACDTFAVTAAEVGL
ncbi:MAG: KPN_02809 family neutral zinc metallopeptidase [Acidimicrobiales bacterium]